MQGGKGEAVGKVGACHMVVGVVTVYLNEYEIEERLKAAV